MPTKRSIFCHRFLFCCCVFLFSVEFLNNSEWIIVHLLVHFRVRSLQKSFSHTWTWMCCWLVLSVLIGLVNNAYFNCASIDNKAIGIFSCYNTILRKKIHILMYTYVPVYVCVLSHENKYANAMTEHLFIIPCSQHKINYVRYDQNIPWE